MEILFTPAAVLDLLSRVEEFNDYHLGITETLDGQLQLQVGESFYIIDDQEATNIDVTDDVVETIEEVNLEAYEQLADNDVIDLQEPVESGILSGMAKALAIGGLVMVGSKMAKKWL